MLEKLLLSIIFIWVNSSFSLHARNNKPNSDFLIVPKPFEVKKGVGTFTISSNTKVFLESNTRDACYLIEFLARKFRTSTGINIQRSRRYLSNNCITIDIDSSSKIKTEGYKLDITTHGIRIESTSENGAFYALQTLFQILPSEIEGLSNVKINSTIPCFSINDYPRFPYRGFLIDVSRHFFLRILLKNSLI